MRRKILTVLLAAVLIFIWGNSVLPAGKSEKVSQSVTGIVNGGKAPAAQTDSAPRISDAKIRKAAHFTEFAVLGLLALLRMSESGLPFGRIWQRLTAFGFGAAFLDETIQLFNNRSSSVRDVWLDFSGYVAGVLCMLLVRTLFRKKRVRA